MSSFIYVTRRGTCPPVQKRCPGCQRRQSRWTAQAPLQSRPPGWPCRQSPRPESLPLRNLRCPRPRDCQNLLFQGAKLRPAFCLTWMVFDCGLTDPEGPSAVKAPCESPTTTKILDGIQGLGAALGHVLERLILRDDPPGLAGLPNPGATGVPNPPGVAAAPKPGEAGAPKPEGWPKAAEGCPKPGVAAWPNPAQRVCARTSALLCG